MLRRSGFGMMVGPARECCGEAGFGWGVGPTKECCGGAKSEHNRGYIRSAGRIEDVDRLG